MADDLRQNIHHQLGRFLVVGAAGFLVDVAILGGLVYGLGYGQQSGGLIGSRLAAFAGAIVTTFLLNARYTFGASIRRARVTRYVLIQLLGALLNIGTFVVLVLGPLPRPLIALALGAAVATVSNFLLVRRFVYSWRSQAGGQRTRRTRRAGSRSTRGSAPHLRDG